MGEFTHQGSRNNLLGKDPSPELVRELSNELQVTKDTPPCFIWHTYEDTGVPVENSLQFAEALRKAGVPFDLHVYQKGPHGLGLGTRDWNPEKRHPWTRDCIFWLKAQGFREVSRTSGVWSDGVAEWWNEPRFVSQHSNNSEHSVIDSAQVTACAAFHSCASLCNCPPRRLWPSC